MENDAERIVKGGKRKKQIGPGRPKKNERSFRLAKIFVHRQKLNSKAEWVEFCKGSKLPADIPKCPDHVYKEQWKGWKDWLGSAFLSYEDAKAVVAELDLKTSDQYKQIDLTYKRLPKLPQQVYHEWEGWVKFLGQKRESRPSSKGKPDNLIPKTKGTHYRPFMEAVKFVSRLGLRDHVEWLKWRSTYKHSDLPWRPDEVYDRDWCGWSIFLGHDPLPGMLENVSVLYVAKYASDPANVYRVDVCNLGKSELNHIAIREGFRLIRMWKYDPTLKAEIKQAVNMNCSSYYGSDTLYIVQNIHGLFADLFNLVPMIT